MDAAYYAQRYCYYYLSFLRDLGRDRIVNADQWTRLRDAITGTVEVSGNLPYIFDMSMDTQALAPQRTARIEARIAPDALALIRRAAELQGRSVSDFVVAAAQAAARGAIEEAQIIRLSVEDQRSLAAALADPPPLAPALDRAIARHRSLVAPEG
jgi:uncharacterized protein (DUF1778 family)